MPSSRLSFRPAPIPTFCTLCCLAILIALGTWQLQRLEWKSALIIEFEARAHTTAIPLSTVAHSQPPPRFQRVTAHGTWLHDKETQLTGRVFDGNAGYHIITPFRLTDGRPDGNIVLVNRGWVPERFRTPQSRPHTLTQSETIEAIIRLPQTKPWLVPDNMPHANDWFTLTIADISRHHQLGNQVITGFTLDAVRAGRGIPIGSAAHANLRNNHLQYALTWYGLALVLGGIYFVWHAQNGRFVWRR
ncbi:MAG: SURF1 family protein [Proteobacteria bacterium]|nr:SURF1 family protein [Pseudomonadota bacterium]